MTDHFEGFPTSSTPFKLERSWQNVKGGMQPQPCRAGPAGIQVTMPEEDYSNIFQIQFELSDKVFQSSEFCQSMLCFLEN